MESGQTDSSSSRKSIRTLKCILCGGNQIYPGPRYENHLVHEHGITDYIDYIIKLSLYKEEHGDLPVIASSADSKIKVNGGEVKIENGSPASKSVSVEIQTNLESLCTKCKSPIDKVHKTNDVKKREATSVKDDSSDDSRLIMDINDDSQSSSTGRVVVVRKTSLLKSSQLGSDKTKRKLTNSGKEWAPNSFSTEFTCIFCNEKFSKDYKLKLHLMVNHKNESPAEMVKAEEVLTKSKLDGCIHKCAVCNSKYNSVANFTRHIKDVHNINRAEYSEKYGSSEVVRRMFRCEICEKDIKHTRNIIGAHMKMVHRISWKEYQEILLKLRQGETVGDLPTPQLFDCVICGVSVKYKREHLSKKHQINETRYDELVGKMDRGEDISNVLPEREVFKCRICERECLDIKKHLERTHKISEELYEAMLLNRSGGKSILKKNIQNDESTITGQIKKPSSGSARVVTLTPVSPPSFVLSPPRTSGTTDSESPRTSSPNSQILAPLSTDLQCYFGCDEAFKKDFQLNLHLKLRHSHEDPDELKKAYEAAEEEIALTRRSGSTYQCALCPKTFNDNGAFYGHIQTKHNLQWREYKDQYGRCEVESSPFTCKICERVVKYDRNTVHTHLKNVHGITWGTYIERIRKMRRGEQPEDLPALETHECRVCNVSVKYLREHLKNVHKITEQEYESLFLSEDQPEKKIVIPEKKMTGNGNENLAAKVLVAAKPKSVEKLPEIVFDKNIPKPPKTDILEKHNKRCSSCNISFDSRRSFIEHCTILHNMKFKTKSGQTISAPVVQERLRKEALKRKAEMQIEAQAKRIKPVPKPLTSMTAGGYIIEMDNAEYDEEPVSPPTSKLKPTILTSQRKTMYTPAGVSKWNQCKYECCFCKWTTMSRSSMTSHLHNTHGIPIQEYKKANYPDIEVETNWFQCRLCAARTKFVKDCIAPHLKMSHGMDIDTYEREIMQPEDWPYEVVPEPSLRSEMRVPNAKANLATITNSKQPPPLALHGRPSPSLLLPRPKPVTAFAENSASPALKAAPTSASLTSMSDLKEDRDKWNRCRYQCCLCEVITIDSRQMRIHIATHHNVTYEEYTKKYGSTEIVSKRFQCSVCASEMKFCRQNIYAHMKDVHKMTLADYEMKYGAPPDDDLDDIAAEEEEQPHEDLSDIAAPEQQDQQIWKQPTGQTGIMDSGILDDGKRPSRWNKCRFRCAICNKLSSEKRHVREHIIKVHGLSLNDYEAQYGECEIHTEYFFCGVCHAEVKHNLKNISLHLQNVHSITPQQYEVQYGRIADDDVDIPELNKSVDGSGGFGFAGSHFMMNDGEGDEGQEQFADPPEASPTVSPRKPGVALPNPPKSDIINPKNKFCLPCNRDFNRRQAFVEHCRTVHRLKLRFKRPLPASQTSSPAATFTKSTTSPIAVASPSTPITPGNGYPCGHCGKVFSNSSNRTRHIVLSCDVAKLQKSSGQNTATFKSTSPSTKNSEVNSDYDDHSRNAISREPIKCPYPDCDVVHLRTALMKRHLCDAHNIQNVSIHLPELNADDIKGEPTEMQIEGESVTKELDDDDDDIAEREEEEEDEEDAHGDEEHLNGDSQVEDESGENCNDSEKKVPPLRVKLHGSLSSPAASPTASVVTTTNGAAVATPKSSSAAKCNLCGTFASNNSYIMGRHKKSCLKKKRNSKQPHGDEAIEVAVEFNHEDDENGVEETE